MPLSFEQEHLWQKCVPNIPPMAFVVSGALSLETLRKALDEVVRRHETLRTTFRDYPTGPKQLILPTLEVDLAIEDLTGLPSEDWTVETNRVLRREATRPFNLYDASLLRLGLVRLTKHKHIFFFTMHHIVSDLWSFRVFLRELGLLYSAYVNDKLSPLAPLRVQYSDYVLWQRECLQGALLEEYAAYWRGQLENLSVTQLRTDYPRLRLTSNEGLVATMSINEETTIKLISLSRACRVTLFMTLIAAFQVFLYHHCGQEDVVVSTLTANRNCPDTEALIGVFANRLVLRTSLAGNPSFGALLSRVRDVCLGAYAHQQLSIWKLGALNSQGDFSEKPMILFTLQDVPVEVPAFASLELERFQCTGVSMFEDTGMTITGRYDQSWEIWKQGKQLQVVLSYRSDLFCPSTVERMLADFRGILTTVVCDADRGIRELTVLSEG